MSDTNLPTYLPAPEDLNRREAADLSQRITAGIASGAVRETPALDVAADRLQAVAQQRVSQATRDAARSTTSAGASPAGLGAAQRQQLAQSAPKAVL